MSVARHGAGVSVLVLCALAVTCGCSDEGTSPPASVNQPPRIHEQPDTSVALGDTLWLRADASDPEGDLLKFRASVYMTAEEWVAGYRPSAGIDTLTGEFWFRANDRDRPSRSFIFDVYDPNGGQDSTGFDIFVP